MRLNCGEKKYHCHLENNVDLRRKVEYLPLAIVDTNEYRMQVLHNPDEKTNEKYL